MVRFSESITKAGTYPFKKVTDLKNGLIKKGVKVIDLGMGDTTLPAPEIAIEAVKKAVADPANHHYNFYNGYPFFREAASSWMERKHGVKLDPEKEITAVIGTKEALFRMPSAFIDPGDIAIIPDPSYPALESGTLSAGGGVHFVPLRHQNGFMIDFCEIPENIKQKAKFIYINYPNNPTSAVMTDAFAKELLEQAHKYDWAILSDMAYSEVYENRRNVSLLEFEGAKERVIEFHSLSKTFSMTGFRIGFACGNGEMISSLVKIKSIRGSSPFQPVQAAGAAVMENGDEYLLTMRDFYKKNRMLLKSIFAKKGLEIFNSESTFYVWAKVPGSMTSLEYSTLLVEKYGSVVTPGSILGASGEGWFRACFACRTEDLLEFERRFI
ncbi:MAG TPA: aminotransferase class I/II-fold pyridoxal phosphate-dependent enzyme [bacterium]|nr:aminotransferase class I/II-fold pyridoxal phosphate-dependent enzyme [bacterium]HQN72604.1 aminotransferase class I/II-fold pyridoxal phosphate-dependent enzyme [bacterium]